MYYLIYQSYLTLPLFLFTGVFTPSIYLNLGVSKKTMLKKFVTLCSYFADRKISVQGLQKLSEKEVTKLVANHLLGRLATSAYYLVDKNSIGQKGDQCFCGENLCKITGHYGDTSVGKSFQK